MIDDAEFPSMLALATPTPTPRQAGASAQLESQHRGLALIYFWVSAGAHALFAVLLGWIPLARPDLPQPLVAITYGVIAVLTALLTAALPPRFSLRVAAAAMLGIVALVVGAAGLGSGAAATVLGFVAMHVFIAMVLGGSQAGLAVTGAAVLSVGGLALAQQQGWIVSAGGWTPVWLTALVQLLLVLVAAGGGWLAGRELWRYMRAASDREQRFSGLLSLVVDAYWELDPSFRVEALRAERRHEHPMVLDDSLVGTVLWEHPAFRCDPEVLDRLVADLGARQRVRDVPVAWQTDDGLRELLISGEPRHDHRGVFRGYWGVLRDVTEQLTAQKALALTESRYEDLFNCLPTPLVLHHAGVVQDANPSAAVLFGFRDPAAMLGVDLLSLYDQGDSRERARRRIERLHDIPLGQPLEVAEFSLTAADGRPLTVRGTSVGVATERGRATLAIYVDDTERQQAEQAVRRSEALLSHLVASSPDIITLTDLATGRYAMVNQTFERVTGWRAEEVIGRTSMDIGIWGDLGQREEVTRLVRDFGRAQDLSVQFRGRDGSVLPMLVSAARFVMDRRDYLVINARDMSTAERERLEREAILANASIGIAMTRDQRFLWVNPAFEAMFGGPPGTLIGQPGASVWPSQADYEAIGQRISPALARGEQVEIECMVRRQDDSTFVCRMLARAVDPSHPSRGGTIWIVEDITERKRVDEALAAARDAAEAANRAKSAFLANTSHELRTPLNHVLGLAQLAREPGIDAAERISHLDGIVDSAEVLAQIVSDILDLSKIEAGQLTLADEPFELPALLQKACRAYLTTSGDVSLALEMDPDIDWVRGDAVRVRQILTNFLSNAFKFTTAGEVRVVARRTPAGLRLEVHDTGPGIDPAVQARLFQPFTQGDDSTTRRVGGTGLGLSICRELAQVMGGSVGVTSTPGAGSCFWAELPLPAWTPPTVVATAPDASALPGARVLVVDDDDFNRMLATQQLRLFGARADEAADGQTAIDIVEQAAAAGDPFQLVLMDLQMPVRSGFEVARALRARYGLDQLPIIAHTAAVLVAKREAALAAGMNDFLPKPSSAERLRRMAERWVRVQRGIDPPPPPV